MAKMSPKDAVELTEVLDDQAFTEECYQLLRPVIKDVMDRLRNGDLEPHLNVENGKIDDVKVKSGKPLSGLQKTIAQFVIMKGMRII